MKRGSPRHLEYMRLQFQVTQIRAMYWMAMATTGACKSRDTAQGREPTLEERAMGITLGFRDHTDEEKVQDALNIMKRHTDRMSELADEITEAQRDVS